MKRRWNAEGGIRKAGARQPGDSTICFHASPHRVDLPTSSLRIRGGFTLLEVIMALGILALISGMVFGTMRTSMKTAVETQKMQMEDDEINRFITLCRHTMQNLPSTATLTLKITETGDPVQQELTISGVPEAFAFGPNPMSYKDSILGMRPDLEATETNESGTGERIYYVGLSREDLIPTDPTQANKIASTTGEGLATPDDQGRYWMPLLAHVTSVTWRFMDTQDDTIWKDEWDSTDLPPLVEMNLLLQGRTLPLRSVFALPTTKLTAANPALAPKTTPTTTTSQQNTGGGGNNRGGGGDRGQGGDRSKGKGSDNNNGKGGDMRRGNSDRGTTPQPKGGTRPKQ